MPSKTYTVLREINADTDQWEELTCEIEVESYYPGAPAKVYGPPEDCYPEEGPELDLSQVVHYTSDMKEGAGTMDLDDFIALLAKEYNITVDEAESDLMDEMYDFCEECREEAKLEAALSRMDY